MGYRDATPEEIAAYNAAPSAPAGKWRDATPEERAAFEASTSKPKPSGTEAVLRGAAQGASAGFVDELGGVGAAIGDAAWNLFGKGKGDDRTFKPTEAYREGRNEYRVDDKAAEAAHPVKFGAANIAGSLATIPLTGAGGGAAKIIGRGAAEGAAYAAGGSEADLTKGEGRQLLEDTGKGALFGGAAAAGGELAAAGLKKLGKSTVDNLKQRILNEVAEGETKTTATARKKLDKAGNSIVKEVVHGKDGDAVRRAFQVPAEEGMAIISPIMRKIGGKLDSAYTKFEKAGHGNVNLVDYFQRLRDAAGKAASKGQTELKAGIEAFEKEVRDLAAESGQVLTLRQLRGMTTQTQRAASSAIGGLNEHATAVLKNRLSELASKEMAATLAQQAAGSSELAKAAKSIAENNQRYYAQKTMHDVIALRKGKEASQRSLLVRGAEKISGNAAILGGGGVAYGLLQGEDWQEKAKNAALGLGAAGLGRAMPRAAKAIDRGRTTLGINIARGRLPKASKAAEAAVRAVGRIGGRGAVEDDED